jgi:outer membrane receptor protein involved in Fe transport
MVQVATMTISKSLSARAIAKYLLVCVVALCCLTGEVRASCKDKTMLMFVGEDLQVLSIASRREESAWQAPAVAQVITRKELLEQGSNTLAQALELVPGFYMAQKEGGTEPYLRGIPNSVLFLYDTVPLGSEMTKSIHPLDHELSLAPVKRIEIVKGPGSVLWGPDAFAGIVNVVPLSGCDIQGAEAGLIYHNPGEQTGAFVNMGHDTGRWDAFLSLSARRGEEDDHRIRVIDFWGDGKSPVPLDDRYGNETPGTARYLDTYGRFSLGDGLILSGRISSFRKPYAVSGDAGGISWGEERDADAGHLKLECKKTLDAGSNLRFTGFYKWMNEDYHIIDRTLEPRERTAYGEIIYDKSLWDAHGLLTGGLSYRRQEIRNAPIWESYFPDFLGPENVDFLPEVAEQDYNTCLRSLFGQYTHKIKDIELVAGLRYDDHDAYKDHTSFTTGVLWSPSEKYACKLLYGTAYRTPFSSQLLREKEPEPEKISTLSASLQWNPSRRATMNLVGFRSRVSNHRMEDPYAGLSVANSQIINGLEWEGRFFVHRTLQCSLNATFLDNSGPDETYRLNDFSFVRPDGSVVKHFVDIRYPFDTGPKTMLNITGTWKPVDWVSAFLRLGYVSERSLIAPRVNESRSAPGVWLLDLSTTVKDLFVKGMELECSVRNLTDTQYRTPGTYSMIAGRPISVEVVLKKRW